MMQVEEFRYKLVKKPHPYTRKENEPGGSSNNESGESLRCFPNWKIKYNLAKHKIIICKFVHDVYQAE